MSEEREIPQEGEEYTETVLVPADHVHDWHRSGPYMRCACGAGYEAPEQVTYN